MNTDHSPLVPTTESFRLEHQILVLDACLRAPLDQDRSDTITRRFVDDLLKTLGMDPLGDLGVYAAVDDRAPGWSFIQPITTSHVGAHYFEKPGLHPHLRLDAYSCESVDPVGLIRVCHRHFVLGSWRATFIDREIDARRRRCVIELGGNGPDVTIERQMFSTASADTNKDLGLGREPLSRHRVSPSALTRA